MRVNGNLEGIKDIYIEALDEIYDIKCPSTDLASVNVLETIADITGKINREISIFISRRGKVLDVAVGDYSTVKLPAVDLRRGDRRLSAVKCIHTHPSGDGHLSSVDISVLTGLRLDAMASVGIKNGKVKDIYIGFMDPKQGELKDKYSVLGPFNIKSVYSINILDLVKNIEKQIITDSPDETAEGEKEKVLLVGLSLPGNEGSSEDLLDELSELAVSAGASVQGRILQKRDKVDNACYIGSGKLNELSLIAQAYDIDTIIFDDELSGAQVRNIEEITGVKVIDRTTLILDIFAMRAATNEGKLQVELAQLKYRLPRLIGLGKVLSRTGGGIGTRGPGEKKLEVDRRHIRDRINELDRELEEVRKSRGVQREKRLRSGIPVISLVGYTNSGKSTLRNLLSKKYPSDKSLKKEGVLEADMLFATLDPTTRIIKLPKGHEVLVSDTVGFIRKLPHDLIEAFRATLEEVVYSDMLIHVVDSSAENAEDQINAVNHVLIKLNSLDKPILIALNKIDKIDDRESLGLLGTNHNNAIEISALYGTGIDDMVSRIEDMLFESIKIVTLNIPYNLMSLKPIIYSECRVLSEDYNDSGLIIKAEMDEALLKKYKEYIVESKQ